MRSSENLRDVAPAFVPDEIYLVDLEGTKKVSQHLCVGFGGHILIWRNVRVSLPKKFNGNNVPKIG
jgi:hypothetical protein